LRDSGFTGTTLSEGGLEIVPDLAAGGPEAVWTTTAAEVNRALVSQGFRVHRLACERPSLESLFLGLTNSPATAPSSLVEGAGRPSPREASHV
jgi:hypothetical protein